MSEFEKYLSLDRVRVDSAAANRGEVLGELANLLGGRDEAVREAVREDLERREQMGSTGVGGGIAFPHARVAPLPGLRIAFLRTAARVDFGAMDGAGVDLFLAIAGPENLRREYLAVLGTLSYLLRAERVRDELRAARTPDDVLELLRRLSAESARPA